ncbi:MAG: hypothetical protein ACLP5H_20495 [Desulfomonilaceae bacterium]
MSTIIDIVAGAIFLMLAWSWISVRNPVIKSAWDWVEKALSSTKGDLIITIHPGGKIDMELRPNEPLSVSSSQTQEVTVQVKEWRVKT